MARRPMNPVAPVTATFIDSAYAKMGANEQECAPGTEQNCCGAFSPDASGCRRCRSSTSSKPRPSAICTARCARAETHRQLKRDVTGEIFERLVKDSEGTAEHMMLIGLGEPFMDRKIFERIEYCEQHGVATLLSTNGTLLDQRDSHEAAGFIAGAHHFELRRSVERRLSGTIAKARGSARRCAIISCASHA